MSHLITHPIHRGASASKSKVKNNFIWSVYEGRHEKKLFSSDNI